MTQTYIEGSPEGLAAFAKIAPDQPIQMLNFVRFKETAEYADDHPHADKGWSGERAYQQYGIEIAQPFARAKAKVVWRNVAHGTIIGPGAQAWDVMFVVEYPNAEAFQTMVSDPEYLAGAPNRKAALTDSRLYLTQPAEQG